MAKRPSRRAASGTYYSDSQRIVLDDADHAQDHDGHHADTLQSADIDMQAGTMTTDKPIEFSSQGSQITGEQRSSCAIKGERISFTGGVKVTYSVPDESKSQPAEPKR